MLSITKEFSFDSAHQLPNLPQFGKCLRLHGHTFSFTVTITTSGKLEESFGMIMNFTDLKKIVKEEILDPLDHRFLNMIFKTKLTTVEVMIYEIANRIAQKLPEGIMLYEIKMWETPTSLATLSGGFTKSELKRMAEQILAYARETYPHDPDGEIVSLYDREDCSSEAPSERESPLLD